MRPHELKAIPDRPAGSSPSLHIRTLRREMTLAEVVRRSLEQFLARYPGHPSGAWSAPEPLRLGTRREIPESDWVLYANEAAPARRET
jgi:hypothetical protein